MSGIDQDPMFNKAIVRTAVTADAVSLAEFGQRLAKNDPYLVVTGFDPITGATLLMASIANAEQNQSSEIFVAEHNGDLVGLALCRCHPPPERNTILQLDLGVDSRHRRRGLGSALVHRAVDWARETGVHRIQLSVVADNRPAIALYEKHGFEIEGTLRKGFRLEEKLHDVLVMARLLK